MIDRVTLTGADDKTDVEEMAALTDEFAPMIEWGILVSESSGGHSRFPSLQWQADFYEKWVDERPVEAQLSIHVCGKWVREICRGNWTPFMCNVGPLACLADRIQLNFHAYPHPDAGRVSVRRKSCCLDETMAGHLLTEAFDLAAKIRCMENGWELIFQMDGQNDKLIHESRAAGVPASPLFDKSGGAGIVPGVWPMAFAGTYNGYAGGLGPDNLAEQLPLIEVAANGQRHWIDMETMLRNAKDEFDLDICRQVLEAVGRP